MSLGDLLTGFAILVISFALVIGISYALQLIEEWCYKRRKK